VLNFHGIDTNHDDNDPYQSVLQPQDHEFHDDDNDVCSESELQPLYQYESNNVDLYIFIDDSDNR
jgi:hypothetical protein